MSNTIHSAKTLCLNLKNKITFKDTPTSYGHIVCIVLIFINHQVYVERFPAVHRTSVGRFRCLNWVMETDAFKSVIIIDCECLVACILCLLVCLSASRCPC